MGGVVLQRPSLTQIGNVVYGGFGGHCDLFNYTGVIIGVDVTMNQVTQLTLEAHMENIYSLLLNRLSTTLLRKVGHRRRSPLPGAQKLAALVGSGSLEMAWQQTVAASSLSLYVNYDNEK